MALAAASFTAALNKKLAVPRSDGSAQVVVLQPGDLAPPPLRPPSAVVADKAPVAGASTAVAPRRFAARQADVAAPGPQLTAASVDASAIADEQPELAPDAAAAAAAPEPADSLDTSTP